MSFEIGDVIEERSDLDELLVYLSTIFLIIFGIILLSFCLKLALWIYIGNFYPDHVRPRDLANSSVPRRDRANDNIYTITSNNISSLPAYNPSDIISVESARRAPALALKDDMALPTYEEVIAADHSPTQTALTLSSPTSAMPPAPPYSVVDPHKAIS